MKSLSRLAVFLVAMAASPSLAATLYSVTAVAGANSNAYGINSSGDVTGVFRTGGGADHAFLYTQANGFLDLNTLSGGNSVGRAINDLRVVVGQSDGRAFRYSAGPGMVALSASSSDARGINNDGDVAIGAVFGPSSDTTTIWDQSNFPTPLFVTDSTEGYAINGSGARVGRVDGGTSGYYSSGASNSSFTDLGFFLPNDINTGGLVTGSLNNLAELYNANNSTFSPIGKLNPSDSFSDAFSVNNVGQVVGVSTGTGGFTWTQAGGMKNLNQLLASGFGSWSILSANGVNDNGWITGLGELGGQQFAVILTPVPEPSAMVLAIIASLVGLSRILLRISCFDNPFKRIQVRLTE